MTNQWVEFVRKWAKKHNQTYMCAASKQKCREAYHAKYHNKSSTQKKRATFKDLRSPATAKKHRAMTRKAKMNKTKAQRELLEKYKAYAEHRKNKGHVVE